VVLTELRLKENGVHEVNKELVALMVQSVMNLVRAAVAVTNMFSPAIVAAFTFLVLLHLYNVSFPSLVGACLTFGTLVPLAIIYILSKRGLISDLNVSERSERTIPFAGAILSYTVGGIALWLLRAPPTVTALMLCYAGNTVLMLLITFRWKISVHASGIAGPVTVLTEVLGAWASIFFALLIPVAWARLTLRAHTPTQILAGALVTILATWLQLRVYLAIL
jgi:membrane-associated phospholipid phosphatase